MDARIKGLVEPAMLVWARKTASLTQEEAAVALDVPLERLQAWEKEGERSDSNREPAQAHGGAI